MDYSREHPIKAAIPRDSNHLVAKDKWHRKVPKALTATKVRQLGQTWYGTGVSQGQSTNPNTQIQAVLNHPMKGLYSIY